ncbi:MAG: ferrous iron transport protein A [Oscillospiraceae bacterium]|nr:ferrous iron transport protein A [Oscillospiraceae bacterium]
MNSKQTLRDLSPGQSARVGAIGEGPMRRRLRDLGLIPGSRVQCLGVSPGGDPKAYGIRGAVIALRAADSGEIPIEPGPKTAEEA